MIELKNDCVVLEGVVCSGGLSLRGWFCPRATYPLLARVLATPDEARAVSAPPFSGRSRGPTVHRSFDAG
jgi:hypothetical protein